jgi:hypothetical protein
MTILEIINKVLRRLREDTVSAINESDYSYMVCELLNDIHQEALDHDWSSMEHVVDVPVDVAQRVLDLTRLESDGGDVLAGGRVTNSGSMLRWSDGLPQAWIFDTSSADDGDQLLLVTAEQMETLYQRGRDETNPDPLYFTLRQSPDRAGLQVTLWPTPTEARHIRMRFWTPEDQVDPEADTNRTMLVPDRVLYLGTVMLALNERGEEMGEPGNVAERRYYNAFAQAIEADTDARQRGNRFESWRE